MNSARAETLQGAARLVAAVLLMHVAVMLASRLKFPYLGGEFHAMFAYSDGHLPAAYLTYLVYLGTACAVAALLVMGGYRLPWGVLALAAAVTAGEAWWSVYTWPRGQSATFHRAAGLLLLSIPPLAFAVCAAAHALRRRMLARTAAGERVKVEPAA